MQTKIRAWFSNRYTKFTSCLTKMQFLFTKDSFSQFATATPTILEKFLRFLPPFIFPQGGKVGFAPSPLGEGWEEGNLVKVRLT
jgi:hypothetical protein